MNARGRDEQIGVATTVSVLCPSFVAAMDMLGRRWNGLLIQALRDRELRFVELKAVVEGISDAMLTTRLAELAGCGLVERRERPNGRAVYALTVKGLDLLPVLDELTAWSDRWAHVAVGGAATRASRV